MRGLGHENQRVEIRLVYTAQKILPNAAVGQCSKYTDMIDWPWWELKKINSLKNTAVIPNLTRSNLTYPQQRGHP